MHARLNALSISIVTLLLLAAALRSAAQTPADPPLAPVPTQILTAKTVFISNVSGDFPVPAGTPALTYNEFYSDMKSWGRFALVSAPADSDLVFEIRFASSVSSTDTCSGRLGAGQPGRASASESKTPGPACQRHESC